MSAANKAKGSSFEIQTETYLNDQSLKAKRLPRSGRNDIGDVSLTMKSGNVLVLELKNVASVNMKEFLRQADVEADNYAQRFKDTTIPAVLVKARQQGIGKARVTMELETLIEFFRMEGLV
jgi:Holliday junction resolvase